jgi:nucleoside-diphosphate-sugar epimerase
VAGKELRKRHNLEGPQGVRGRNSDNRRLRKVLDWEPSISLRQGLRHTYLWIDEELRKTEAYAERPEVIALAS